MATELLIDRLGQHGDGIAERPGQTPVYVPFALPGERIAAEIEGERGRLADILAPSPARASPFCPYFGACGGCQLQHLALDEQRSFKRELVISALRRAGLDTEVSPTIGTADGRRRVTLHARQGRVGFMRMKSHDLLEIAACPILVPQLVTAAPDITRAIHKLLGDCDVSFTETGLLDIAIRTPRRARPAGLLPLARRFPRIARVALNGEMVYQAGPPLLTIGKASVTLPVESFLQPSAGGEAMLAELVLAGLVGRRKVADLFCGVGTFALRIAETARVFAADGDRLAISAMAEAVRNTSGLKPLEAKTRDLFREPMTSYELAEFDAVVFDPPRAGAEAQARELAKSPKLRTVIGVSCDPKTFARDAAILGTGGFRLVTVTPVDQFAHSTHVELVGVFRR